MGLSFLYGDNKSKKFVLKIKKNMQQFVIIKIIKYFLNLDQKRKKLKKSKN